MIAFGLSTYLREHAARPNYLGQSLRARLYTWSEDTIHSRIYIQYHIITAASSEGELVLPLIPLGSSERTTVP